MAVLRLSARDGRAARHRLPRQPQEGDAADARERAIRAAAQAICGHHRQQSRRSDLPKPGERRCANGSQSTHNRRPSKDCIHHSDRGSQYAAEDYRAELEKHDLRGSMGRRARAQIGLSDNRMAKFDPLPAIFPAHGPHHQAKRGRRARTRHAAGGSSCCAMASRIVR